MKKFEELKKEEKEKIINALICIRENTESMEVIYGHLHNVLTKANMDDFYFSVYITSMSIIFYSIWDILKEKGKIGDVPKLEKWSDFNRLCNSAKHLNNDNIKYTNNTGYVREIYKYIINEIIGKEEYNVLKKTHDEKIKKLALQMIQNKNSNIL